MGRFLLSWVLILACGLPVSALPPDWAVRVKIRDKMRSGDQKRMESWGSGALVSPTHILTNNHVVKDRMNDGSYDGNYKRTPCLIIFNDWSIRHGKVIATDAKLDLALIELAKGNPKRKTIPLGDSNAKGQLVRICGYDGGIYGEGNGTLSKFKANDREGKNQVWFEIEGVAARGGDSGGPVVDQAKTKLLGILWGSNFKDSTSAVRIEEVKKFLGTSLKQPIGTSAAGVQPTMIWYAREQQIGNDWVATMFIECEQEHARQMIEHVAGNNPTIRVTRERVPPGPRAKKGRWMSGCKLVDPCPSG